jgi:DNA-binding GntR family transcriptional regulator
MRELNTEFHQRILGFSKLQFIVSEVRRLYLFVVLYRNMFVWTDAELERSNTEHLQILGALREHNSEALVEIRNGHANAFDAQVASRVDTSTD